MDPKFLDRWASNVMFWRKNKLPVKDMIERLGSLTKEDREKVRELVFSKSPTEGKVTKS